MNDSPPSPQNPEINYYKLATPVLVLTAFFFLLYQPVIFHLVSDWSTDDNYSHGYIVPFMSLYLIWEKRKELLALTVKPSGLGFLVLLAGLIIMILGHVGAELFLGRFSMLVVLAGIVLFLLGKDYLKVMAFPIGFLIFMIPLPAVIFNALAFPLQLLAAKVATNVIYACGIPVLRDGNIIHLANTTLEVAEACSGIRSLVTIMTLATIYAYFMERTRWKQIVLFFASIPIAIITNSTRVTFTGFLSHYYGEEAAKGFYHTFEGWFMFVVAFSILLVFGFLLGKIKLRSRKSEVSEEKES